MEGPVPIGDDQGFPILSIAPMIQWTDRHYRYMMRLITKETQACVYCQQKQSSRLIVALYLISAKLKFHC